MAGPNLPTSITAGVTTGHVSHTATVHGLVNKFDTTVTPTNGHVLTGNGTTFVSAAPATGTTGAVVTPETYGAVGNGATDDQTALTSAIAALNSGDTLLLTKKYRHTGVINVNKAGVTIDGYGELYGTVQTACAVHITANNVTVNNIKVSSTLTVRQGSPDAGGLIVGPYAPVTGYRSTNVRVVGNGYGVLSGSSDFILDHPTVLDAYADGIHITGGSHHGKVIGPTVVHPGDDGVAVVSYVADSAACSDIDIVDAKVYQQYFGRGISCVGGTNITYIGFLVSESSAAAVYFACESGGSLPTRACTNVHARGGRVVGANVSAPDPEHGSLMIANDSTTLAHSNVSIQGVELVDSWATFININIGLGTGGGTGIKIADVTIKGSAPRLASFVSGTGASSVVLSNIRYGVTQFRANAADSTSFTTPVGQLYGAAGSTAMMPNGSYWLKYSNGTDTNGWVQLGSGVDAKFPSTPTNLTLTPGTGQITVSWTASTDNTAVVGYRVRMGTGHNTLPGEVIATVTSPTVSYVKTGLTAGVRYTFSVSAYDAAGNESMRVALGYPPGSVTPN